MSGDALSNVIWGFLAAATLALAGLVFHDATQAHRTYTSAYDATDPFHEHCSDAHGAGQGTKVRNTPLASIHDRAGKAVGQLELRYSIYCGTDWPRVLLSRLGRHELRGSFIRMAVIRSSDQATAAYILPISANPLPYGWGNMIAQQDSCVFAEAYVVTATEKRAGPRTSTSCLKGG
jgi:hypothetical protein